MYDLLNSLFNSTFIFLSSIEFKLHLAFINLFFQIIYHFQSLMSNFNFLNFLNCFFRWFGFVRYLLLLLF